MAEPNVPQCPGGDSAPPGVFVLSRDHDGEQGFVDIYSEQDVELALEQRDQRLRSIDRSTVVFGFGLEDVRRSFPFWFDCLNVNVAAMPASV
jgi:hypothetical protein